MAQWSEGAVENVMTQPLPISHARVCAQCVWTMQDDAVERNRCGEYEARVSGGEERPILADYNASCIDQGSETNVH